MEIQSLKWMNELQAEQADVASHVLSQYTGEDRGGLARNKAVGGRRGSGDRQMNRLVSKEDVLGGDTSPEGADIKSLSQLDEFRA